MNETISTRLVTFEKNYLPDNIGKNTRKWLKDYFKLLNL